MYFIATVHIVSAEFASRIGLVMFLALVTQNCLRSDPRVLCDDSGWLLCFEFVPPAPEVQAEIKTTLFYNAFCPLILRLKLSHNAIKIRFNMTCLVDCHIVLFFK